MDYTKILTRSFEIVWKNRALWLFGILLALFGGSGGGGGGGGFPGGGSGTSGRPSPNSIPSQFPQLPTIDMSTIWTIVAVVVCVILTLSILALVLRFISRAALIGLVNELEMKQTKPEVSRGFSIGWSRFKSLLGIAILVNLPLMLFGLILLLVAALPIIGALSASGGTIRGFEDVLTFAGAGSITLLCCVALVLIAVTLVVHPIYEFIVRVCVIGNRGAMDSIREGFRTVRTHLGNVVVLYIVVIAVGVAFGIAMLPIGLILIGIPVGVGAVIYIVANAPTAGIIVGLLLGIPMLAILIWIGGLYRAFESTLWTEGYLQVTQPLSPPAAS